MFEYVKIQVGIPKSFGDADSAEQGIVTTLDLTGGQGPFALDPEGGWIPKIAQSKGGIWAESNSIEGRILQSVQEQNVTEEMIVHASAGTVRLLGTAMVDLRRIIGLCRDYWQTDYQIEPVYLNVLFLDAPGPQYALIYNMDVSETFDIEDPRSRELSLSIEREPFWRPIVPGANPRLWTFHKKNQTLGREAVQADLDFTDFTKALIYDESVSNRAEWDSTDYDSFLSKNWLDISLDDVDGDAPALAMINFKNSVKSQTRYTFGIAENPQEFNTRVTLLNRTSELYRGFAIFNAGDANDIGGMTKTVNSCAPISNGQNSSGYAAHDTIANGTADGPSWSGWSGTAGTGIPFTINQFLGAWMVFMRAGATNGADDDIQCYVEFAYNKVTQVTNTVGIPAVAATNCQNEFALLYMGMVDIIPDSNSLVDESGLGLWIDDEDTSPVSGVTITIKNENTHASTRDLRIADLILIPVHRIAGINDIGNLTFLDNPPTYYIADSTGYFAHGKMDTISKQVRSQASTEVSSTEFRGQNIQINPRVNSRLYFFGSWYEAGVTQAQASDPTEDLGVSIDIVPRWRGVRDV